MLQMAALLVSMTEEVSDMVRHVRLRDARSVNAEPGLHLPAFFSFDALGIWEFRAKVVAYVIFSCHVGSPATSLIH